MKTQCRPCGKENFAPITSCHKMYFFFFVLKTTVSEQILHFFFQDLFVFTRETECERDQSIGEHWYMTLLGIEPGVS